MHLQAVYKKTDRLRGGSITPTDLLLTSFSYNLFYGRQ
jgi:hypothetical protein